MRKLEQRKVWVSIVTCSRCKAEEEFWHHGEQNRKEAVKDWPSESWNGWFVGKKGKELCPLCYYGDLRKGLKIGV